MALNTNLTQSAGISPSMQTYYDKKLLMNAKPNLVHQKYGQQVVLPKNSGKSIQFRKWTPFKPLTEPLQEGVVPNGQNLEMTSVTAEIQQYGGYVAVSDLLDLTAIDPVVNDSVELMGDQGGLTIDTLTKNEICTVPNVQFARNKTSRAALSWNETEQCKLTVDEVRKAVRTLKKNRAPQFVRNGKGHYIAIVGPETTYDLQSDPLWQDVSKYAGAEQIFEGEIGKLFGVVFVETTEACAFSPTPLFGNYTVLTINSSSSKEVTLTEMFTNAEASAMVGKSVYIGGVRYSITAASSPLNSITLNGAPSATPNTKLYSGDAGIDGRSVAGTLVFGKNAYGVVDIESGNMKSIIKPKGSAGTADPLEQISTIGWKVAGFACKVLQPLWIVRIEHLFSE